MQDYEDIESKNDSMKSNIEFTLLKLEKTLIKGRDEEKVPIYLTKWRIKSNHSIYLKYKRKPKSEITDRGGMRILCLFEQDISPTFIFIIKKIKSLSYRLIEVIVYNWEDEEEKISFKKITEEKFGGETKCSFEQKKSGYKSIHLIATSNVDGTNCSIEIQLRTLLQDVWGELEHSLSYKQGNIHPHIKKSFSLLANDLQTNDKLIAHLRDISDKEKNISEFTLEDKKPTALFSYEDGLIDGLFDDNGKILLEKYDDHIEKHWKDDNTKWIEKARNLYEEIENNFGKSKRKREHKVKYWLEIEDAFLLFADKKYDLALDKYVAIADTEITEKSVKIKINKDKYVPQFRKGEIKLLQGRVEESLIAFDKCEKLLNTNNEANKINVYTVKSILANVYWQLGEEYIHLAVEKIQEAELICNSNINQPKFTPLLKATRLPTTQTELA